MLEAAYDVIVVGGGSGGCVVARRLAEDRHTRVLLIEAGPPDDNGALHDLGVWAGLLGGAYDWGYEYAPSPRVNGRRIAIPRGRVLGGSSSINAGTWYRGHPADYDAWAAAGAEGWGFEAVLPYFRRSEDWEGGATGRRGVGGPMRIERPADPHPVALAMLEGAAQLGLPVLDDYNDAGNEGAALSQLNMRAGRRWSTADGYLHPASGWPNLTVLTGSVAFGLEFAGRRCVAVRHWVDGAPAVTRAGREIVLALGAIGTPVLLMHAGIGDPAELARLGIPVRVALRGVGRNLQDHPLLMGMNFRARAPLGPPTGNGGGALMNWRSHAGLHAPDLHAPDLHAFVVQGPHAGPEIAASYDLSGDVFAISPGLMGSRSVGALRLLGTAPDRVAIQPNFLAEAADVEALTTAVEMIMDLAETPAYRALIAAPAAPDRRLTRPERIAFVRQSCSTFFHTCGTCAMGNGADAVVDPQLRVHGIEALRVADASVIPVIPSCNTQAPVVMIAERAAAFMQGGKTSVAKTLDQAALDQWYAVETLTAVTVAPRLTRLLGQDIVIVRAPDGSAAVHEPDGPALPTRERYGCLWTTLGDPAREVVSIGEADEADRRFLLCGWTRMRASGLRVVENFLDMAHFPFVHTGILGAEPHTEVPHYVAEIRRDVDEVWATDCQFFQPRIAATEASGGFAQLAYRVPSPFTVMLYRVCPTAPARLDVIALFIHPVEEDLCRAHPVMFLVDAVSPLNDLLRFEQVIFLQDRIIVENQRPVLLPLDPHAEIPTRADSSSVVYRRWLKEKGLWFGTDRRRPC